jgi:hypothetical protein
MVEKSSSYHGDQEAEKRIQKEAKARQGKI